MEKLVLSDVTTFVEKNIGAFHKARLEKVKSIKLDDVLKKKNPYLFKAKNVNSAADIINEILTAFLSSSEEGIFGNWLERLAIFINVKVYKGRKSGMEGIDLEFEKDGHRYLVTIKSGSNWGNSSQVKKLIDNFDTARKTLSTSGGTITNVVCVNGCCYGVSNPKTEFRKKGTYYKYLGQKFWDFISNEPELYTQIVEPLGHEAAEKNKEFKVEFDNLKNRITLEFMSEYCKPTGAIDWDKLVRFNSGIFVKKPPAPKKPRKLSTKKTKSKA